MAFDDEAYEPVPAVVLVEPLSLARLGLRSLLRDAGVETAVSEVADIRSALPLLRRLGEGIVIASHRPPLLDALALLQAVRLEGIGFRVAIVDQGLSRLSTLDALRFGVEGLLPGEFPPERLGSCIAVIAAGGRWLDTEVLRRTVNEDDPGNCTAPGGMETLTPRQREIADLVTQGMSNKEIARALGIAEGTVKLQLHRIYRRTGTRNRTLLAAAVSLPPPAADITGADTPEDAATPNTA